MILRNQRGASDPHAMRDGRAGPSFAEFVRYLAAHPDQRLNGHWRPQTAFPIFAHYDHVFRVEHLGADWASSDLETVPLHSARQHAAIAGKAVAENTAEMGLDGRDVATCDGATLHAAMKRSGLIPAPRLFFEDTTTFDLFCKRYEGDIRMYAHLFADERDSEFLKRALTHIEPGEARAAVPR